MKQVKSIDEITTLIASNSFCLIYVSRKDCSVCHSLLPQIDHVLKQFPAVKAIHVDADIVPEVASEFTIFTVPALLVFVNQKEVIRQARFIPIKQLRTQLNKVNKILNND